MMSSADGARGLCPLDSRPSPGWRPPQTAPEGSALWTPAPPQRAPRALPSGHPLGLCPRPEMLCISVSPAGGMGAVVVHAAQQTCLPKAGQSGRAAAEYFAGREKGMMENKVYASD